MLGLNVRSSEDVAEILEALPTTIPVEIVRSRSPRLGPVGKLIWGARKALRGPCIAALQAQTLDSGALVNAIRILLFLPQTSRAKDDRIRRANAGFTTSALDGCGLRNQLPARPSPYAWYPVLVHWLASLLHASFRPRLASRWRAPG